MPVKKAVEKAPVKKAVAGGTANVTKKVPVKKVAKKASAGAPSALTIIKPGDEGWDSTLGKKGKKDSAGPLLLPLIEQMLAESIEYVQFPSKDQGGELSVNQVRNWYGNQDRIELLGEGKRLKIGGGEDGRNIYLKLVDEA